MIRDEKKNITIPAFHSGLYVPTKYGNCVTTVIHVNRSKHSTIKIKKTEYVKGVKAYNCVVVVIGADSALPVSVTIRSIFFSGRCP